MHRPPAKSHNRVAFGVKKRAELKGVITGAGTTEAEAKQLVALVTFELKESPTEETPLPVKALKVRQLIENLPTKVPDGFDKVEGAIQILKDMKACGSCPLPWPASWLLKPNT